MYQNTPATLCYHTTHGNSNRQSQTTELYIPTPGARPAGRTVHTDPGLRASRTPRPVSGGRNACGSGLCTDGGQKWQSCAVDGAHAVWEGGKPITRILKARHHQSHTAHHPLCTRRYVPARYQTPRLTGGLGDSRSQLSGGHHQVQILRSAVCRKRRLGLHKAWMHAVCIQFTEA